MLCTSLPMKIHTFTFKTKLVSNIRSWTICNIFITSHLSVKKYFFCDGSSTTGSGGCSLNKYINIQETLKSENQTMSGINTSATNRHISDMTDMGKTCKYKYICIFLYSVFILSSCAGVMDSQAKDSSDPTET